MSQSDMIHLELVMICLELNSGVCLVSASDRDGKFLPSVVTHILSHPGRSVFFHSFDPNV